MWVMRFASRTWIRNFPRIDQLDRQSRGSWRRGGEGVDLLRSLDHITTPAKQLIVLQQDLLYQKSTTFIEKIKI